MSKYDKKLYLKEKEILKKMNEREIAFKAVGLLLIPVLIVMIPLLFIWIITGSGIWLYIIICILCIYGIFMIILPAKELNKILKKLGEKNEERKNYAKN